MPLNAAEKAQLEQAIQDYQNARLNDAVEAALAGDEYQMTLRSVTKHAAALRRKLAQQ
jgi:hypothetical protein